MIKNIYQNQKGVIAIAMTILVLALIFSSVMVLNTIVLNNLVVNIVQVDATKAFFAGEAGAEKILYETRKGTLNFATIPCADGQNICFESDNFLATSTECVALASSCAPNVKEINLANGAKFSLIYATSTSAVASTTVTAIGAYIGTYGTTTRDTEIQF
jgi:hypothetical protein